MYRLELRRTHPVFGTVGLVVAISADSDEVIYYVLALAPPVYVMHIFSRSFTDLARDELAGLVVEVIEVYLNILLHILSGYKKLRT